MEENHYMLTMTTDYASKYVSLMPMRKIGKKL
jgi:hypothetical protein